MQSATRAGPAASAVAPGPFHLPAAALLPRRLGLVSAGALLIAAAWCIAPDARADRSPHGPAWVSHRELMAELAAAPKENTERERMLRELYVQAGADAADITLQEVKTHEANDPVLHNVLCRKTGKTDDVIVVGGHLDKVDQGRGVIDDWSGACLATNLYQTLRPLATHHSFVFIGFAYEEKGLLGSRAYVKGLRDEDRKHVKAMLNLECLGVDDPFIWTNGSTDSLEAIAHRVASEHHVPLRDHVLLGVSGDSVPFEQAGIPNITFDGLAEDHFGLIHSDLDDFARIRPRSYGNAYRLATWFLIELDKALAAGAADAPK